MGGCLVATLKQGTKDTCRKCGRAIEWSKQPDELDENGVLIPKYFMRQFLWVDVDPPGDDVWSPYCNFTDRVGAHVPATHCTSDTSNGKCFAKVKDPIVASDGSKLFYCKTHAKKELQRFENRLYMEEQTQMDRWQTESIEHLVFELRCREVKVYAVDQLPAFGREYYRVVDVRKLMEEMWKLEVEIKELKEEIANVGNGQSNHEGQQGLVVVSV